MSDEVKSLIQAAIQIVQGETMLGGFLLPAASKTAFARAEIAATTAPAEGAPMAARTSISQTQKSGRPAGKMSVNLPPLDVESLPVTREQKTAALEELKNICQKCGGCQLGKTRTNLVFGEGDPAAQLVFVGEAPGADEDASGRPFVGRAGQKLTEMILAMGLRREDVYICNILKCRPPDNRPPAPQEAEACKPFLIRQLQIIHPKVIVTLGNPATQNLLQTTVGITKLRGQWQKLPNLAPGLEGISVMPTFHPSYLIRAYTPENRRAVWSDLQQVMEMLGIKSKG